MSRLVFIYMSEGSAHSGYNSNWSSNIATNRFYQTLPEEGYYYLIAQLLKRKVFDEVVVVIESNRGYGISTFKEGIKCYVVPTISEFDPYIKEGDIIWARGGFKSWFPFLESKKGKHWLMLYAANTGRQRWKFWDVIIDDLSGQSHFDKLGRFFFSVEKCINPDIFKDLKLKREVDICIGASYIHDKKGQFKVIDALIQYQKMYNEKPLCYLPGASRRGTHSNLIPDKIKKHDLNVIMPGMLPRSELATLMNRSKLFIHAGASGENDRGPLEAMKCGAFPVVNEPKYHSPLVSRFKRCVISFRDILLAASEIKELLTLCNEYTSKDVIHFYNKQADPNTVIIPKMTLLFDLMKNHAPGNLKVFKGL
jgi:hypothetical protein